MTGGLVGTPNASPCHCRRSAQALTFTVAGMIWYSRTTRTEWAQVTASGEQFARYWVHSAMVNVGSQKMAKSFGQLHQPG